jgi:maltooligosyltrehalose trehalohydrolase
VPWLDGARSGRFTISTPGTLHLVWPLAGGRRWHLLAQLADHPGPADLRAALPGDIAYSSHGEAQALQPWSVLAALQSR